jgi:hypothetical protein
MGGNLLKHAQLMIRFEKWSRLGTLIESINMTAIVVDGRDRV